MDIIFLSGMGRSEKSYKKLFQSAPKDWNFHFLNSTLLLKNGVDEALIKIKNKISDNNLENVSIIGHSLGGGLAILFVSVNQERVKRLYLWDTIGLDMRNSFLADLSDFLHPRPFSESLEDSKAMVGYIRNPILAYKLSKFVRKLNLKDQMRKIKVPTTIVWGEKDLLLPVANAAKFSSLIEKSRVIILPNCGHDWPIYTPEEFWRNMNE